MASHDVLKQQLSEMGFEDIQISSALTKLGENATIESVIETIESSQLVDITDDNKSIANNSSDEQKVNNNENVVINTDNAIDLEAKRLEYEEKIRQRRKEREEKEKEAELQREIQRRKDGQSLGKMKEELQNLERKRVADEIKREKAEEKAARDAILKQIAADREERKSRTSQPVNSVTISSPTVPTQTSTREGSCRLAIRLLDGTQLIHEFDSRESLSAVRVYVITQKSVEGDITFAMPPIPPFNEEDMQKPLNVLGLCPSARIHVVKR